MLWIKAWYCFIFLALTVSAEVIGSFFRKPLCSLTYSKNEGFHLCIVDFGYFLSSAADALDSS